MRKELLLKKETLVYITVLWQVTVTHVRNKQTLNKTVHYCCIKFSVLYQKKFQLNMRVLLFESKILFFIWRWITCFFARKGGQKIWFVLHDPGLVVVSIRWPIAVYPSSSSVVLKWFLPCPFQHLPMSKVVSSTPTCQ